MTKRAELTSEPDGSLTLSCDELRSCWNFNSHHIAVQAQFALLKMFDAWEKVGAGTAMTRADFMQCVRFVMASYEAPLTETLFNELQRAPERPKLAVIEGGK